MIKGWPAMALTVVAAIAIGAGLALTGGPGQARKERRDQQRADDLSTLAGLVECLAGTNRGQLPDRLAVTLQCDWQAALNDPYTGQPYRYEATGPRSYRLCAGFETPPPDRERFGPFMRDAEGCIGRLYVPVR
mgnify:CR=1 FL=1